MGGVPSVCTCGVRSRTPRNCETLVGREESERWSGYANRALPLVTQRVLPLGFLDSQFLVRGERLNRRLTA